MPGERSATRTSRLTAQHSSARLTGRLGWRAHEGRTEPFLLPRDERWHRNGATLSITGSSSPSLGPITKGARRLPRYLLRSSFGIGEGWWSREASPPKGRAGERMLRGCIHPPVRRHRLPGLLCRSGPHSLGPSIGGFGCCSSPRLWRCCGPRGHPLASGIERSASRYHAWLREHHRVCGSMLPQLVRTGAVAHLRQVIPVGGTLDGSSHRANGERSALHSFGSSHWWVGEPAAWR